MKKLLLLMLIGALSFTMVGCDDDFDEEASVQQETEVVEEPEEIEEVVEEVEDALEEQTEEEADGEELEEEGPCDFEGNPILSFSTEDIDGNPVSLEDFADAKLIMINFWEPWCGPCVGEMPDLEKIYELHKDEGFVILGVFSSEGVDGDVKDVIDYCGTTYPILRYESSMEPYTTEYVPTTVFIDQHGHVLNKEPIVGSNEYDKWNGAVERFLNR